MCLSQEHKNNVGFNKSPSASVQADADPDTDAPGSPKYKVQ